MEHTAKIPRCLRPVFFYDLCEELATVHHSKASKNVVMIFYFGIYLEEKAGQFKESQKSCVPFIQKDH